MVCKSGVFGYLNQFSYTIMGDDVSSVSLTIYRNYNPYIEKTNIELKDAYSELEHVQNKYHYD